MNALALSPGNTSGKPLDVELTADELNALFVVGRELYERNDFTRAANTLRLLVLVEPLFVEGWQLLGACHEELSDFEVAARMYETGCRMGGNDPRLALLAARASVRDGDMASAARWLAEIEDWELDDELEPALSALRSVLEGDTR
jgi:uncharacterized protein HemY